MKDKISFNQETTLSGKSIIKTIKRAKNLEYKINLHWSFIRKIIPIVATSILLESLQYIFAIGATDITDFLMNTLGGALGIIAYSIICKIFKDEIKINKILNMLASIGTMGFILLMGVLILANI